MALRKIIKLPNPNLRRTAHKVIGFEKDFQNLVDDMIDTMRDEPGVGLAAPQIDVPLKVIVVEYSNDDSSGHPKPKLYVLANPEIVEASTEVEKGIEGCLSVPGIFGEVKRSNAITVKGFNRFGKKTKFHASGWLARIFQHEIDHLNGILFIDRADQLFEPEEIQEQRSV
jgi:peptide deformylase